MTATTRLPLAEWAPDLPDTPGAASAVVKNVYPKTQLSYGPVHAPAPIYDALDDRCRGAATYIDKNGIINLFAGTRSKLYVLRPGDAGWTDVSNSSRTYDARVWRFSVFNGDVIAIAPTFRPQYMSLATGTEFADLPDFPPYGRFIAIIKNSFVMLGDTYDSNDATWWDDRLMWSAAGDHTDWPAPGSTEAAEKQSGSVRLLGPSGRIMGLTSGLAYAEAVVFQRFGAQRLLYSGPPTTFSILPIENGRGCMASDSIVTLNGIVYYWSDDGIFAYNGQEGRSIGASKVDRTVYADLGPDAAERIVGASDPARQLIIWAYPSLDSSDGTPDRLLFYSPPLDRFTLCEVTCETVVKMMTLGYTLTELETVLGYATLDSLPYPLDSDVWKGGSPYIGIFDTDHKLNYLAGTPLAATVDTAEMQLAPGKRQFVTGVRPLIDGVGTVPTVSVGHRERMQADVTWSESFPLNGMGTCPVRTSGRYLRARVEVPESTTWNAISGVEVDAVLQGRR